MAVRLDVPARFDEGREALRHIQTYVSACRMLGYRHPDLTSYDRQVDDAYDREAGLDLRMLDEDCGRLRAGLAAAEEALRMQRGQIGELAAAWTGPGADRAVGFIQRHCDSAATTVAAVRTAVERCATLTDALWQLIDEKVAATVDIDDRVAAPRDQWLAAARTVTAGLGDRATAADIVEQQITPYVDNDIRTDWLAVIHSTRSAVAAAYAAATDGWAPTARFEIPGEFGVRYQSFAPAPLPKVPAAPIAAHREKAAGEPPLGAGPAPETPVAPVDAPLPVGAPEPALGAAPAGSPIDTGSPTDAGDLSGLLHQFVEAIDGLRGAPEDELDDAELDPEPDDEEPGDDGSLTAIPDPQPPPDTAADPDAEPVSEPETPAAQPAEQPEPQDAAPAPTPCEIAADELPQVGE